jgi:hypothetical protein
MAVGGVIDTITKSAWVPVGYPPINIKPMTPKTAPKSAPTTSHKEIFGEESHELRVSPVRLRKKPRIAPLRVP